MEHVSDDTVVGKWLGTEVTRNAVSEWAEAIIENLEPLPAPENIVADDARERTVLAGHDRIPENTLRDLADEKYEDAYGNVVYICRRNAFVHSNVQRQYFCEADDVREYFSHWTHEAATFPEEILWLFGIEKPPEAEPECLGKCRVWIAYHYHYREIGTKQDDWLRNEWGQITDFENYAAAEKWVNDGREDRLEHGESSQPDFIIWEIKQGPVEELGEALPR